MTDNSEYSYNKLLQSIEREYGRPLTKRIRDTFKLTFDAHSGQLRKTATQEKLPYIVHPVGTALHAIRYFSSVNMQDSLETIVCTALAHDVLEDNPRIHGAELEQIAGKKVREYVEALTKPPSSVTGKTSEERNEALINRIIVAGPTAVYLKVCDNIQNLSRPTITPTQLFRKTVDKAESLYIPMLERCQALGKDFQNSYVEIVRRARNELSKREKKNLFDEDIMSLDSAIDFCIRESSSKILELHDIPMILKKISQADDVSIWKCGGKLLDTLTFVCGTRAVEHELTAQVPGLTETTRTLSGKSLKLMMAALPANGYDSIITVPMHIGSSTPFIISLGFTKEPVGWLRPENITVLVNFLAHRLIISEAYRRIDLASEIASMGVKVDIELAAEIGMIPSELDNLCKWQNYCQQAILNVEHLLKGYLASGDLISPLRDLIRIESRVKTVDSIVEKFKRVSSIKWPDFRSMEDIAGVRVVCPTLVELSDIETYLLGSKLAQSKLRLHPDLRDNRRNYFDKPLANGYKALHLILEVDVEGEEGVKKVPCELQLRTMFMDIWSAISHLTLYQADHNTRRRKGELLKELALAMEQCERITSQLVEKLIR